MRKLAAIIGTVVIMTGVSFAAPMNGKIGFGVGTNPGASILEPRFFSMRIGLTENIVIEPTLEYYSTVIDEKIDSLKETDTNIGIAAKALFAFLTNEKSNLYGTFGFGVDIPGYIVENYSTGGGKATTSEMLYTVLLGLALEHFLTPNFSVCISSEGGFTGSSAKTEFKSGTTTTTTDEISLTSILIGNTNFGLMFFWYFN